MCVASSETYRVHISLFSMSLAYAIVGVLTAEGVCKAKVVAIEAACRGEAYDRVAEIGEMAALKVSPGERARK